MLTIGTLHVEFVNFGEAINSVRDENFDLIIDEKRLIFVIKKMFKQNPVFSQLIIFSRRNFPMNFLLLKMHVDLIIQVHAPAIRIPQDRTPPRPNEPLPLSADSTIFAFDNRITALALAAKLNYTEPHETTALVALTTKKVPSPPGCAVLIYQAYYSETIEVIPPNETHPPEITTIVSYKLKINGKSITGIVV